VILRESLIICLIFVHSDFLALELNFMSKLNKCSRKCLECKKDLLNPTESLTHLACGMPETEQISKEIEELLKQHQNLE